MATASKTQTPAAAKPAAKTGYPAGSLRFDWAMTGLSAVYLAGLWIDGWAHFHGEVDGSFFTPWHFLFYSAFGLVALFLGYHQLRNINRGYAFTRALPEGYWLSLIGVMLFALGGVGDMIWHTLFGIEAGTEALLSPSHIMLAIGMALIFTGPVRAAWIRARDVTAEIRGWRALGPMIVSMTLFLTLVMFFTSYAHPVVSPLAFTRLSQSAQDMGVTSILFQAGFLSGVIGLLVWRWRLPFGTFAFMLTLSTALLTVLNDLYVFILPALIAGLIIDVLAWWLKPSPARTPQFFTLMFAAPFTYYALYFATVHFASGIRWSIHVWAGAIFLAGVVGALVAIMISASNRPPSQAASG